MDPIATYRWKSALTKGLMELFEDRIVITGGAPLRYDYVSTVQLAALGPSFDKIGFRENLWIAGSIFFAGGTWGMFGYGKHTDYLTTVGFWVNAAFCLIGTCVLLRSCRRIEAVTFSTSAGVAKFSICKVGPDIARYQEFVDRVVAQIKICRAVPAAPS